jgi:hypothetical protein
MSASLQIILSSHQPLEDMTPKQKTFWKLEEQMFQKWKDRFWNPGKTEYGRLH